MRRLIPLLIAFFALAPPAEAAWIWPVSGEIVTPYRNGTDPYANGQHRGIDIAAPDGSPIVAAASGEVRFAGTAGSSGLTISIRTGDGYDTSYLHLSSVAVRAGAHVSAGDRIGAVGTTGTRAATAPHLHFGVRNAGTRHDYRDPLAFLPPPPPPAGAPDPRPPAPAAEPEPAPPAAAPVGVPRAAPRTLPRPAPEPRAVPRARPHAAPLPSPHRVPHARPNVAPHPRPHAVPRAGPQVVPEAREIGVPHSSRAIGESRAHANTGARSLIRRPSLAPSSGLPEAASHSGGDWDIGWAVACAVLLLAAGLLGMTGGARRRPPRRTGGAFSLAKWPGKTPNPAQPPRG